jgi:hypothetical protein
MVALKFLSGPKGPSVLRFQETYIIIKTILAIIGNNFQECDMVHAFLWLDINLFHR